MGLEVDELFTWYIVPGTSTILEAVKEKDTGRLLDNY